MGILISESTGMGGLHRAKEKKNRNLDLLKEL